MFTSFFFLFLFVYTSSQKTWFDWFLSECEAWNSCSAEGQQRVNLWKCSSYQLLTLGSPACVLQLSISHLWRVQVPRLPGVHRGKENGVIKTAESDTHTQKSVCCSQHWSSRGTSVQHVWEQWLKCVHKYWRSVTVSPPLIGKSAVQCRLQN